MKSDSVIYKPNGNSKFHEEKQIFLDLPNKSHICSKEDNKKNNNVTKSYHKRCERRRRKFTIIKIIAAVCLAVLIAVIILFVYWSVNHYFEEANENISTISTSTDDIETTPHKILSSSERVSIDEVTAVDSATSSSFSTSTQQRTPTTTAKSTVPIIFVPGKQTFSQAVEACSKIGRKLALKEDMNEAFISGYERCQYGWLGDGHAGYVMQRSGARQACGGGQIGLIYTPHKDPESVIGGAYCASFYDKMTTPYTMPSSTKRLSIDEATVKASATVSTHLSSRQQLDATTKAPVPVKFVPGKQTFSQAVEACSKIGRKLALKEDMFKAFKSGYERCQYGWLGDGHAGYVMQRSGARQACGGGKIGLIYTPYKDPESVVGGAYCASSYEDVALKLDQEIFHNNSINWWVTMDPADVFDLKYLLQLSWKNSTNPVTEENSYRLLKSLHVVYPCCSFLNITMHNKNATTIDMRIPIKQMKSLIELYKKEFMLSSLKVFPHLQASYEAMIVHGAATFNRSRTIDDIVAKAVQSGVDGLIMDYEPVTDYTRRHAETYRDFLNELHEKLAEHHIKLGTLISGWGILKYYDVYSTIKCEIIGSMSNTYYGHNITKNIHQVNEMMKFIKHDRLQVGIGSMHKTNHKSTKSSFGWSKKQLQLFVDWLRQKNVEQIHIWPAKWGNSRDIEQYFINALVKFVK